MLLTNAYEIAQYIKDAKKETPVKLYVNGQLAGLEIEEAKAFGTDESKLFLTTAERAAAFLEANASVITDSHLEYDRRNSAVPMLAPTRLHARIDPGPFIRDPVPL